MSNLIDGFGPFPALCLITSLAGPGAVPDRALCGVGSFGVPDPAAALKMVEGRTKRPACQRGSISRVALDCGGTPTSNRDSVDAAVGMRPVAAAQDVIWGLDAADIARALTSNTSPGQDRRRALHAADVGKLFGGRVYRSDELGVSKPSLRSQYVLADLGIRPRELLMCGNNVDHDIVPAAALGIRAALLGPHRDRLRSGAVVIDHIADLPYILIGGNPCASWA